MRYVRVDRRANPGEALDAKSRLILPGHTDPELGLHRTDSPTTSTLAVIVCAILARCLDWGTEVFDVTTAFLSGKELTRELYARAPREGLPAIQEERWPRIRPLALILVIKGAYGLTEAPRLWYLRAREILAGIGFVELTFARATFVCWAGNRPVAFLTLHVDDGMLHGDHASPEYQRIRRELDKQFRAKFWKTVNQKVAVAYLGMSWALDKNGCMVIEMDEYINEIRPMEIPKGARAEEELPPKSLTEYKSLLQRIRWPVQKVVPELAYSCSALAQGSQRQWTHVRALNELAARLQDLQRAGRARIVLRPFPIENVSVLTVMDASFAKEPGLKS